MFQALLSGGLGIWGGMQAQAAADTSAAMSWSAMDRNLTQKKYGLQANMGMGVAQMNNNALAQRENADITKEMAMFGAEDLARKKGQVGVENFERMLGASNSPEARSAKRFEAQLNAQGAGMAARSTMAGLFGKIGDDYAFNRGAFG